MTPVDLAALLGLPELPRALEAVEVELDRAVVVDASRDRGPGRRVVLGGGQAPPPGLALACAAAATGRGDASSPIPRWCVGATSGRAGPGRVPGPRRHHGRGRRASGRARPSTRSRAPSQALLVGDFLLARAGQLAAGVNQSVAAFLATAIADLCVGQSAEVATLFDPDRSGRGLRGAPSGARPQPCSGRPCEIGARPRPRRRREAVEALAAYGTAFGMAFQVVDDVLDLVSTAEALGKPVGNDIREGVYSLPVLIALAGAEGAALGRFLGHRPDEAEVAEALALVRASSGGGRGARPGPALQRRRRRRPGGAASAGSATAWPPSRGLPRLGPRAEGPDLVPSPSP